MALFRSLGAGISRRSLCCVLYSMYGRVSGRCIVNG